MIAGCLSGPPGPARRVATVMPGVLVLVLACCQGAGAVGAQALAVSSAPAALPDSLAQAIQAQLQAPAVVVRGGDTTLEFWWVKGVEVSAEGPGWAAVDSGTLVGALRVTGAFKEIRGKPVAPGVYTLRFGLQPQNGDHLGISPYREFLLLSPAEVDTDPKVLGFDGAVALAKQTIGTSHPASLSLDPPEDASGAALSEVTNEFGHHGVVVELTQTLKGKTVGSIKFGLIVIGLIVH